jgi:hypothetical protein
MSRRDDFPRDQYGMPCYEPDDKYDMKHVRCPQCDGEKWFVKTTIHLATGKTTEEELHCEACDVDGKVWV